MLYKLEKVTEGEGRGGGRGRARGGHPAVPVCISRSDCNSSEEQKIKDLNLTMR